MRKFFIYFLLIVGGVFLGTIGVFASDITVKVGGSKLEFGPMSILWTHKVE